MVQPYELTLPADLDEEAAAIIETKGWLGEVTVAASGARSFSLSFYDPVRLGQEIVDELDRSGFFSEPNLIVVPSVTRTHIEEAVRRLSETDFAGLVAS